MRTCQKGYTLVELIIVILIIAILASYAFPLARNWIENAQYREASQLVVQALRQGQNRSVTRNREYRVEFDLSGDDSYCFRVLEGNRASNSTSFNTVMSWEDASLADSVALRGVNPANGNCTINVDTTPFLFSPDGTSNQVGGICILDRDAAIRSGILVRNTATGRVTVEEWDWTAVWP